MARSPRPRILQDVRPRRRSVFSFGGQRLNLTDTITRRIPVGKVFQFVIAGVAILSFVLGSVTAPTISTQAANSTSEAERQALEQELKRLESEIDQYQDQITGYQKQGRTLKGEIGKLNGKIAKLNLQIQAINLTLSQLDRKITETKFQIETTESTLLSRRETLSRLVRSLYENEQASLVEIFLKNPKLSDFFTDLNNIVSLQSDLRVTIVQISDLHEELKEKQEQFSLARADAESVRVYQATQKSEVENVKKEKNKLLEVTQGQETKYQSLLKQTKETAAQIRSRIFELLGGGELSFEQAYEYAKLAGGAAGVRPALVLAVLDRESALGQNVGRCNYKTAMSPSSQPIFLEITRELSINPDVVTVSCPNRDGAYGGAMGPAQFIPSTWKLYRGRVSKVTGNAVASPWNNADAFVATSLYLKDLLAACEPSYGSVTSKERCAAARYYAGSRWRSYLWTYGEAVVSRAQSFQQDINTITS